MQFKGQNETVDCLVNDVKSSTEFLLGSSSGSLYVDSSSSLGEGTNIAEEASANLFVEDGLSKVEDHAEVLNDVTEGNFYPTELIIVDNDNRLNSIVHSADSNSTNLDTLANLSLREKVANFIQNGDLDPVEGNCNV